MVRYAGLPDRFLCGVAMFSISAYGFAAAVIFLGSGFMVLYGTVTYLAIRFSGLRLASAAMIVSSFLLTLAVICLVWGVSLEVSPSAQAILAGLAR